MPASSTSGARFALSKLLRCSHTSREASRGIPVALVMQLGVGRRVPASLVLTNMLNNSL